MRKRQRRVKKLEAEHCVIDTLNWNAIEKPCVYVKKEGGKMKTIIRRACLLLVLLGGLLFTSLTPSYAMTLRPQADGNYTIENDDGTKATDISAKTILFNADKYHSDYWIKARIMLEESIKVRGR